MNSLYDSPIASVKHSLDDINILIGNPGCLSLFNKIIKLEDKLDRPKKIVYQINLGSRSTQSTPKPISTLINAKSWGKNYTKDKKWDGITWVTVESSIEKFIKFVENGFAYRLGIKEKGNDRKNYVGSQGIAFDLDHNPSITLEQTVQKLQELELHGIIHYSPSGNPTNNKLRLIIFFDKLINDYQKVDHLTQCIGSQLPNNANQVHDPARFFYGTILPIPHIETKTNKFDFLYSKYSHLIDIIPEGKSSETSIDLLSLDDDNLTIPQKFGIKFKEWLETNNECLGNFIIKICQHFDLELHNWHEHGSKGDNHEQWRGLDPILPEESTTGSSFTVYHAPNGTYGYKSDRVGAAGDLIDLWYRLKHHCWDINGSVKSRLAKSNYWECLREICRFIGVSDWSEEFAPKPKEQLKEVVSTINVEEAKLNILEDELVLSWQDCYLQKKDKISLDVTNCGLYFCQEHKNKFYYDSVLKNFWIKEDNIWRRKNETEFKACVLDFLLKQPKLFNKHTKQLLTAAFKSQLASYFTNLTSENLAKGLEPSWNYIGCKNGIFNIKTKELLSYPNDDAFLTHILPYTRRKTTGIGIKTLRTFLEQFFDDARCIDDFLMWVAGVTQQRGFKMRQAISLVGSSGSGKSDLTNLITSLVSPTSVNLFEEEPDLKKLPEYEIVIAKHLRAYQVLADNNTFDLQTLEHQRLIVFPEFTGFTKDSHKGSDFLKNLIGDSNSNGYKITTAVKHANESRDFYFRGAIITNSQEYPKLQSEDDGISRRFMFIKVNRIKTLQPELFNALQSFEVLEDLWNYFLDYDLEPIYERMKELSSSRCEIPWKIDSTIFMNQANNNYWKFANDKLEVVQIDTITESDTIPSVAAKSIYEEYKKWSFDQGETYVGTQTAFGLGITKAIAMLAKTTPDKIKKRTSKGVIYQFVHIVQMK